MKRFSSLVLLGTVGMFASCTKREVVQVETKPVAGYSTPGIHHAETEFTAWMSRAELQYLQENHPAGYYFARVEGRNNQGRLEYRAVSRPFDGGRYDQWAVFWGIDETELFDWELRLLRTGFARQNMQSFQDAAGKALYQIVWTKDRDASSTLTGSPAFSNEPVDSPTGSEEVQEPVTTEAPVAIPVPEPVEPARPIQEKVAIYIVQPGDTLGKIARRKGVSVGSLKATNKLKSDVLRIGQKLTLNPSVS